MASPAWEEKHKSRGLKIGRPLQRILEKTIEFYIQQLDFPIIFQFMPLFHFPPAVTIHPEGDDIDESL